MEYVPLGQTRPISRVIPHPQPLSQCGGRGESDRVDCFHFGATLDVSTPSRTAVGEGWGEGLRRRGEG